MFICLNLDGEKCCKAVDVYNAIDCQKSLSDFIKINGVLIPACDAVKMLIARSCLQNCDCEPGKISNITNASA